MPCGGDFRHFISELDHGLTASLAAIGATAIDAQAADQRHGHEGVEDGSGGEMHDFYGEIWGRGFDLSGCLSGCLEWMLGVDAWNGERLAGGEVTFFIHRRLCLSQCLLVNHLANWFVARSIFLADSSVTFDEEGPGSRSRSTGFAFRRPCWRITGRTRSESLPAISGCTQLASC